MAIMRRATLLKIFMLYIGVGCMAILGKKVDSDRVFAIRFYESALRRNPQGIWIFAE